MTTLVIKNPHKDINSIYGYKGLIDGDLVAYRLCCGCVAGYEDGIDIENYLHDWVEHWREHLDLHSVAFAFSSGSFRYRIFRDYKRSRKDIPKPPLFHETVECIRDNYPTMDIPEFEADDVLSLYQSQAPTSTIMISWDKDMLQVPGQHYNPIKKTLTTISESEARDNLHLQWLMGDSTDCYSGVPGIGPVKAKRWLAENSGPDRESLIYDLYQSKGISKRDADIQKALAQLITPAHLGSDGTINDYLVGLMERLENDSTLVS